jgi:linoleoyl-CoA desaturase
MWLLYGVVPIKWQLWDDFVEVIRGQVGEHRVPRPRGGELALFVAGKIWFFAMAFAIPTLVHPLWQVLLAYAATGAVLGVLLGTTFQLAHCVPQAAYPEPDATNRVPAEWAVAQVESTVDFAPRNRLLTWYLGGLNYQIEHHLFPKVSHAHYPALAPIVARVSRAHGVRYHVNATLRSALRAHQDWLRTLGRAPARS